MSFVHYKQADLARWREDPMNKDLVEWLEKARDDLQEEALTFTENGTYNQAHQALGGARALLAVLESLRRIDEVPQVRDDDDDFDDPAMPEGEIRKGRNGKESVGTD